MAHSTNDTLFWESLLPSIGSGLFSFEDQSANNKLKDVVQQVFSTGIPATFSITINKYLLQCTALRHSSDTAYICWETNNQSSLETVQKDLSVRQDYLLPSKPMSIDSVLQRITDNLPLAVFEVFLYPDGSLKLGFVNREFENSLFGQSTKAVNRDNSLLFENVHPDDKQILMNSIKDVFELNVWDVEYRLFKDGETRWIKGHGRPEIRKDDNCLSLCAYLIDITNEKKYTSDLAEGQTLLRTLIDNLPVSIFVKDEKARKTIANKLDVEYMGLNSEEEALGKTDLEIYANQSGNGGYAQDLKVLQTGMPVVDEEGIIINKDGTQRDIMVAKVPLKNEDGEVTGLIGICKDITTINKLNNQLKLVEHSFKSAALPMYFGTKEGKVYDYNNAICKSLGYTKEEFGKLTVFDISTRHTPESWKDRWKELKAGRNQVHETKLRKKGNLLIDVEITTSIFEYHGIELTFTSFIDITEKKKAEEDLILSNQRYENATIATSDAIFEVDFTNNTVFLSKNYYTLLGYDHYNIKDLSSNDWTQHIHPEDLPRITEYINKVLAGEGDKWENEYRIRKADGNYIMALDRGFAIRDKDGKVSKIVGAIQDITKRKQEEERLHLLEKVVTETTQSIIITDAEEGLDTPIIYANDAFTMITGYTLEEVKGKNPRLLHNAMDTSDDQARKTMRAAIKNLLPWKVEIINARKNGEHYWAEASGFPVFDKNKGKYTHWVAMQTDITSRKMAEEALAKSIERYENATIATSDVIWEWDLATDSNYLSKNFTTLFGHPSVGLQYGENNSWRRNLHPDDKERVLAKETEAAKGISDKWESEYRLKKANGEFATVLDRGFCLKDNSGKVLRLVGAIQDITKRKEEETKLRLMESAVVNINDSIVITEAGVIDSSGPRILFVNEAFEKMTGYTPNEIIGKSPRALQNQNTDRKELDKLRAALQNMEHCEVTILNTKKNGEEFWVNVRVAPVADENGRFTHWVAVQRDVTKEKEANAEKEDLLNELMENNKELTQFSYITTHNFRAPLTNLVTICHRIDTSKIEDSMTVRLIQGFKQSTMLLNDTLNDLINILIIKEKRHLETSELLFSNTLDKVKNSISTILVKNVVKIETDFSQVATVNFSDVYLESIFLNLLTNSIKYAHPTRYPIINIKTFKDEGGTTKLTFSDNGLGMNMERVKNKIFGLYQRFHNNPEGKGIGLYLVQSQITALGGKIEVESEEGVGTTFTITFK